jgi:hypothetical protein
MHVCFLKSPVYSLLSTAVEVVPYRMAREKTLLCGRGSVGVKTNVLRITYLIEWDSAMKLCCEIKRVN